MAVCKARLARATSRQRSAGRSIFTPTRIATVDAEARCSLWLRACARPLLPDGNKRIALAVIDVFLRMNGLELAAAETDAVDTVLRLAAGEISEDDLARWIEANSRRTG